MTGVLLRHGLTLVLTLLSFAIPLYSHAASEFRISSGETKVIKASDPQTMLVERWVMEDNSTLEIEAPVWTIQALRADFGRKTRILGMGKQGDDHSATTRPNIPGTGPGHETGSNGSAGKPGGPGKHGTKIAITVGLGTLDDLVINVSGGNGGGGGKGGKGQKGGIANCIAPSARGGTGGNGGPGGAGGNGGNGGSVTFTYWVTDDAAQRPRNTRRGGNLPGLRIVSEKGKSGGGGRGGFAGDGGDGIAKCDPVSGGRGMGPGGQKGRDGKRGAHGKSGFVAVMPTPAPK